MDVFMSLHNWIQRLENIWDILGP